MSGGQKENLFFFFIPSRCLTWANHLFPRAAIAVSRVGNFISRLESLLPRTKKLITGLVFLFCTLVITKNPSPTPLRWHNESLPAEGKKRERLAENSTRRSRFSTSTADFATAYGEIRILLTQQNCTRSSTSDVLKTCGTPAGCNPNKG